MNIDELKRLAEAATPGQWRIRPYIPGIDCGVDGMFQVCHHASARDAAYIAAANPAAVLELIRQRDELLAALKEVRDLGHNYTQVSHRVWIIADDAITNAEKSQ